MKVIFDLNYWEAKHILQCLRIGQAVVGISNANFAGLRPMMIDDLSLVVSQMLEMDPTVGTTGPKLREWTAQIYLEEKGKTDE